MRSFFISPPRTTEFRECPKVTIDFTLPLLVWPGLEGPQAYVVEFKGPTVCNPNAGQRSDACKKISRGTFSTFERGLGVALHGLTPGPKLYFTSQGDVDHSFLCELLRR